MSSLRTKLARLGPPVARHAVPVVAPTRTALIDDLRDRMDAVLARARPTRPPPEVDTLDLPFVTHETPSGPLHVRTYRVAPGHRMGRVRSLGARDASSELLALLALDPTIAACD